MKAPMLLFLTFVWLFSVATASSAALGTHTCGSCESTNPWEIGAKEAPDGVTWFGNEWT